MLIPARPVEGAPRCWEHTPSAPGRHGGVAGDPVSGYVAAVRHEDTGRVDSRRFASLPDAEAWLLTEVNGLPATGEGAAR